MVGDLDVMGTLRFSYVIMSLLPFGFLITCSKNSDTAVVDTVNLIVTNAHEGREYYMVRRISGWHDKSVIIQLFDSEPKLGECSEDLVKPIFEDSIELDKPLVNLSVDVKGNDFKLVCGEFQHTESEVVLEFRNWKQIMRDVHSQNQKSTISRGR
ncbi:MAG: hypothetical protein ACI93R_001009 [Flavobacteriales bacterium]|jgi:hypothetical protein